MHILNESEWIHRQAEEVRKYNTLPNKDNKNLEYQQLHTKIYLCNDCGVLIHSFCVCVCVLINLFYCVSMYTDTPLSNVNMVDALLLQIVFSKSKGPSTFPKVSCLSQPHCSLNPKSCWCHIPLFITPCLTCLSHTVLRSSPLIRGV